MKVASGFTTKYSSRLIVSSSASSAGEGNPAATLPSRRNWQAAGSGSGAARRPVAVRRSTPASTNRPASTETVFFELRLKRSRISSRVGAHPLRRMYSFNTGIRSESFDFGDMSIIIELLF